MKKISKYVLTSIVLLSLIIACTKEITDDLIASFKLEFNEATTDSFFNIPKSIEFTITGGSEEPSDYSLKYVVDEGAGFYEINDTPIEENEYVVLSSLTGNMEYTGRSVGSNKVTIIVKDQLGREEEFVLTYDVKDTDFSLVVTTSPESTYVDGSIDLNLNISEATPASYEVTYVYLNQDADASGTGVIMADGEVIEPETTNVLPTGDSTWQFTGATVGVVEVEFVVTSSLGVEKREKIGIAIDETPDFTFTATTISSELATNTGAEVNFELTETVGSSTYIMKYTSSNTGVFMFNDAEYQPGDEIIVEDGLFSGAYKGTVMGSHEVEFIVANANTIPVERSTAFVFQFTDPDIEAPLIELIGEAEITIRVGEEYNDPGVTVTDNIDPSDAIRIDISGSVDISQPETYTITYTATDTSENSSFINRKVIVIDDEAPVIQLLGNNPLEILTGGTFTDPGVTLSDNVDTEMELRENLTITNDVNTDVAGSYTITYSVMDSSNNPATLDRMVKVVNDTPPVIKILGENPLTFNARASYIDEGATVTDDIDQDLTINTENNVISNDPGMYEVIYTVKDSGDNSATAKREVTVIDTEKPVITLSIPGTEITHTVKTAFTNPTAVVTDNAIDALTAVVSGSVDINTLGENVLTYTAEDLAGNTAMKTFEVNVIDDVAPVISLNGGGASITLNEGDPYVETAAVSDNYDTAIDIMFGGDFSGNTDATGSFERTYNAIDASENLALEKVRKINIRSLTSFNRQTGILKGREGKRVVVKISSDSPGSWNGQIEAKFNEVLIGRSITCSGASVGIPNCSGIQGSFEFVMPAGEVRFFGRHRESGTSGAGSSSRVEITIGTETFEAIMVVGQDIGAP